MSRIMMKGKYYDYTHPTTGLCFLDHAFVPAHVRSCCWLGRRELPDGWDALPSSIVYMLIPLQYLQKPNQDTQIFLKVETHITAC